MFKIALGAGHGINTAGKRIPANLDPNETREWQLNDRIADKVEEKLKAYSGYELLRLDDSDDGEDDVALSARTNAANAWGADFYLSIHHNAGINGGTGGGIVSYSLPNSVGGAEWSEALYAALIDATGLKGNRWDGTQTATFHVLRESDAPAVLLELGFMDSKTDAPVILSEEYAEQCADAIVKVLADRGGLVKTISPESPADYAAISCDKAVAKGIFLGDGQGNYGWPESVSRQDLCVVLDRLGLL